MSDKKKCECCGEEFPVFNELKKERFCAECLYDPDEDPEAKHWANLATHNERFSHD